MGKRMKVATFKKKNTEKQEKQKKILQRNNPSWQP